MTQKNMNRSLSRGIFLILLAAASFASGDAAVKWISTRANEAQIIQARYLVLFVLILVFSGVQHKKAGQRLWTLQKPALTLGRSLLLPLFDALFIFSFILLPLTTVTAVLASVPILVTLLSVFILGEQIRLYRWIAVICGCLGVLVVVNPLSLSFDKNLIFPLAGIFLLALYQVLIKVGADYEHPRNNQFYMGLVSCVVTTAALPFFWQDISVETIMLLLGLSFFHAFGHLLMMIAMSQASPAKLQPFTYTGLIWATFYGWLFFAEWPDSRVMIGLSLIVASGLFVFYRQHQKELD